MQRTPSEVFLGRPKGAYYMARHQCDKIILDHHSPVAVRDSACIYIALHNGW